MSRCSLCAEVAGGPLEDFGHEYASLVESGRNALMQGDCSIVVPSIGALNSSHLLVIPRVHVTSLAQLPHHALDEIAYIKEAIRRHRGRAYSLGTDFFEHGMGTAEDTSGSCVAHAHLHAIDHVEGLLQELQRVVEVKEIDPDDLARKADIKSGYAYFETAGRAWLANDPCLRPQWFRQAYADLAGGPDIWSWRADRRVDAVQGVLKTYSALDTYCRKP